LAIVKPFKGVTYNLEKVLLKQVISPNIDLDDKKNIEKFASKTTYNISNLLLSDSDFDNSFHMYKQWKKEKILLKEQEHIFYLYEQEFELDGRILSRTGFVGLNKIDLDYDDILIDESFETDNQNLELVKSIKSNINQIVGLYKDNEESLESLFSKVKKTMPVLSAVDDSGIKNTIWLIDEKEDINFIENQMKDKKVLIADGFETYKTAIRYCKYMREKNEDEELDIKPYDFIMTTFFNIIDSGVKVYNLARVLKYENSFNLKEFMENLNRYFRVKKLSDDDEKDIYPIIMYLKEEEYGLIVEDEFLEKLHPANRKLISFVLHKIIINEILKDKYGNFTFYLAPIEDINFQEEDQLVFSITVNAKESVLDIFEQSTSIYTTCVYTYPKLQSGLIINEL
jgi:uncharacterized protein (DUF1015 family)